MWPIHLRVFGVLLFFVGSAGIAYSTWAVYKRQRPLDVLFAVLAPLALALALAGILLLFVPGFF